MRRWRKSRTAPPSPPPPPSQLSCTRPILLFLLYLDTERGILVITGWWAGGGVCGRNTWRTSVQTSSLTDNVSGQVTLTTPDTKSLSPRSDIRDQVTLTSVTQHHSAVQREFSALMHGNRTWRKNIIEAYRTTKRPCRLSCLVVKSKARIASTNSPTHTI